MQGCVEVFVIILYDPRRKRTFEFASKFRTTSPWKMPGRINVKCSSLLGNDGNCKRRLRVFSKVQLHSDGLDVIEPPPPGIRSFRPRVALRISSDGDDRMGTKIKTKKNPWAKLTPQYPWVKFPSLKNCNHKPSVVLLYSQNYAAGNGGTTTNLQIEDPKRFRLNIPKNPHLNQSTSKKYLPNFPIPKNPRIKNFKPKTSLDRSPCTCEIQAYLT